MPRKLPPETWEERDGVRLRDERLLQGLLRREEDGERERLLEREQDEQDEREPSCDEEEDTEFSLSERRLRRPTPLCSSSRIRFLIRLD